MTYKTVIILMVMALVLTVGSTSAITADIGDNPAQEKALINNGKAVTVTSASNPDAGEQSSIENMIVLESSHDRTLRPSGRNDRGGGPRRDQPGNQITTTQWSHGEYNRYNAGIAYDADTQRMWLTSYQPAWIGAVTFDGNYQFSDVINWQPPNNWHPMGAAWYDDKLYVICWANYFLSTWDENGTFQGIQYMPNQIRPTAITVSADNGWLFVTHHPSLDIYVFDINDNFKQIGLIDNHRSILESVVVSDGEPTWASYSRSILWVDKHPNGQLWLNTWGCVQYGAGWERYGNRAWQFEIDDDWNNNNGVGTVKLVQRFTTFEHGDGQMWDGLGHDGNNLWASAYSSNVIRIIDDGINELDPNPALPPPEIAVDPQDINSDLAGGEMEDHTISISNEGYCFLIWDTYIEYTVGLGGWVDWVPEAGVIEHNNVREITVTLSAVGKPSGDYEADLFFTSNDPGNPDLKVSIFLHVESGIEGPIDQLIIDVNELVPDYLSDNQRIELIQFLHILPNGALWHLSYGDPDDGGVADAIDKLEDFIEKVDDWIDDGDMDSAEGLILREAANDIIVQLGGEAVQASDPGITLTVQTPVPSDYYLSEAYPNPFNNQTTIRFGLPEDERVRITVYDLNGRQVAILLNSYTQAGWHSTTWTPRLLANGEYLVRMEAGEFVKTRRLVFLK